MFHAEKRLNSKTIVFVDTVVMNTNTTTQTFNHLICNAVSKFERAQYIFDIGMHVAFFDEREFFVNWAFVFGFFFEELVGFASFSFFLLTRAFGFLLQT